MAQRAERPVVSFQLLGRALLAVQHDDAEFFGGAGGRDKPKKRQRRRTPESSESTGEILA